MREWGNMECVPEMCQTDRKTGNVLRPVRPKNWLTKSMTWIAGDHAGVAKIWLFVVSIGNFVLFYWIYPLDLLFVTEMFYSPLVLFYLSGNALWYFLPPLLLYVALTFLLLLFYDFVLISLCIFFIRLGVSIPVVLSIFSAFVLSELLDNELLGLAPAFSAMTTALLALVSYIGLGPPGGLSYDCSTIWKNRFYDFLG